MFDLPLFPQNAVLPVDHIVLSTGPIPDAGAIDNLPPPPTK